MRVLSSCLLAGMKGPPVYYFKLNVLLLELERNKNNNKISIQKKKFKLIFSRQNLSGTIVAVINIITLWVSPNPRTAAIYYFITALFILVSVL